MAAEGTAEERKYKQRLEVTALVDADENHDSRSVSDSDADRNSDFDRNWPIGPKLNLTTRVCLSFTDPQPQRRRPLTHLPQNQRKRRKRS